MPTRAAVIDGEIVLADEHSVPNFYALQHALSRRREPFVIFAFDLLHRDGVDLRGLPLIERKRRLARIAGKSTAPNVFFVEHFADAAGLFEWCERLDLEGIRLQAGELALSLRQTTRLAQGQMCGLA